MTGKDKPKKGPEASEVKRTQQEYLKAQKQEIRKNTQQSLKELRGKLHIMTTGARGADIPSIRHGRFLEKAEMKFKQIEAKYLKEFDALLNQHLSYKDLLVAIDKLKKRQKHEIGNIRMAYLKAWEMIIGKKKTASRLDYAYAYTILENIDVLNNLYGVDIGVLLTHIQENNLAKNEWDKICEFIKKYPYQRNVGNSGDSLNLSVTAFLFKAFDQNQRYRAIIEFSKRYSNKEAEKLADALVKANILNIKQYEELMKYMHGKDYEISAKKEREIKEAQDKVKKLLRGLNRKLRSSMAINGAERVLNRKNILSFLLTGIGTLGMITNYLANLQAGKGIARFTAGFKSPYFLFSAAVTAGGVHMLQKGMTAGSYGESFFSRLLGKSKRLNNPFGVGKTAEIKDTHFDELVNIFGSHGLIEKYFLTQNGFEDLADFYTAKRFDAVKRATEIKEDKGKRMGEGMNLFDEYVQFVEKKRGRGKPQAIMLRETANRYGKATMTKYLIKIAAAQQALGITTSEYFNKTNIRGNLFTHRDLLLHREGIKAIPREKLPEVRAKKAEAKANKKRQQQKS